jgi:hypothetical protein
MKICHRQLVIKQRFGNSNTAAAREWTRLVIKQKSNLEELASSTLEASVAWRSVASETFSP